jgi:hypothetical protein
MSTIRLGADGSISSSSQGDVASLNTSISNLVINDLADVDTTGVTTNSILKYNGANWVIATDTDTGITAVVEDTNPQLGGDLDVNTNSIISTSNGDITLTPDGTGNVVLGNLVFDVDQTVGSGQDNYVLTYDNATGLISLEASAAGITDIVNDTTPQLGGDLDAQTFDINNVTDLEVENRIYVRDGSSGADKYFEAQDAVAGTNIDKIFTNTNFAAAGFESDGDIVITNLGGGDLVFETSTPASNPPIYGDTTTLTAAGGGDYTLTLPGQTGTLMTDLVDDTTPQLGGDLDLNTNSITGTGSIDISTATGSTDIGAVIATNTQGLSGNAQNAVRNLVLNKITNNTTRRVTLAFKHETTGGTENWLITNTARDNGTYKEFDINATDDTGATVTQLASFRMRPSDNNIYNYINGITEFLNPDASFYQKNVIMNAVLNGETAHAFFQSSLDNGASTVPDGVEGKWEFGVRSDSESYLMVGRITYEYDTTEIDNSIALDVRSHDDTTRLNELKLTGKETRSDKPVVLPSYTVSTLPTNVSAGATAYVTDESTVTSGKCLVFYDGTNWKLSHSPNTTAS